MERFTRTYLQYNQYDQDGRSYEWRNFENQNMTFEEAMAWLKKNGNKIGKHVTLTKNGEVKTNNY